MMIDLRKYSRSSKKHVTSLVSLTVVVVLFTATVFWHGSVTNTKNSNNKGSSSSSSSRSTALAEFTLVSSRFLTEIEEEGDISDGGDQPKFDDDETRSETCKHYLYNFLNGTTDNQDECQAFYKAYQAADCQDDTHVDIVTHQHTDKNGTVQDDDVILDDFFENWECCDSIQTYYEKNCEPDRSELHSIRLLGIMLVLLACTSIKALIKQFDIKWLPDSCAFIVVGAIVGGILRLIDREVVERKLSFDNDLFLQILLPPIIFQAALSIDKRAFRRDLFPILAFAGLGTLFSAISIGLITHHVSSWGNGTTIPLLDSFLFGSLISSIDPVATLGILSGVGVSQTDTLYTLIFGESLLNDGVAIVLFDTLRSHLGEETILNEETCMEILKKFAIILFGSIGIGLGCGMLCTIYFWLLRGRQTAVTEVAVFFCWALIPYYIADGTGCSGIISIMVMGFFLDYFVIGGFQSEEVAWMDYMAMRCEDENGVRINQQQPIDRWSEIKIALSKAFSGRGHILSRSRHHVGFVAHVIASVMETAIFAYLGLFLFNGNEYHFRLDIMSIFSCVSSRLVMVIVLSLIINICVYFDFENTIFRWCRECNRPNGINVNGNNTNNNNNINDDNDDDDENESISSNTKKYLDGRTQLILLLAGIRGAVSFALVENIPVYDNVTKTGSKFKAELKAMTSSSIFFTLFVFGALTYYIVKRNDNNRSDRVAGPLTHRLLSEPLDSDDDNLSSSDLNSGSGGLLDGGGGGNRTTTPQRGERMVGFNLENNTPSSSLFHHQQENPYLPPNE